MFHLLWKLKMILKAYDAVQSYNGGCELFLTYYNVVVADNSPLGVIPKPSSFENLTISQRHIKPTGVSLLWMKLHSLG
jgi:hypothetical protein